MLESALSSPSSCHLVGELSSELSGELSGELAGERSGERSGEQSGERSGESSVNADPSPLRKSLFPLANPIDLLNQGLAWLDTAGWKPLAGNPAPLGLELSGGATHWQFYWQDGQLIYASHSIEPWERLDRHLGRLAKTYPALDQTLRNDLRHRFLLGEAEGNAQGLETNSILPFPNPEYQAIHWLHQTGQLPPPAARQLVAALSLEVLESYLLLPLGSYKVRVLLRFENSVFWQASWQTLANTVEANLAHWRALPPQVTSPYQRPLLDRDRAAQLPAETQAKLSQVLRGFSFRQLGMWLGQEDWAIAQRLAPLIRAGVVVLEAPIEPFDQLPTLAYIDLLPDLLAETAPLPASVTGSAVATNPVLTLLSEPSRSPALASPTGTAGLGALAQGGAETGRKVWKIVCVDDSQAILNEMRRFLEPESFALTLISDAKSALLKITSIKPDLILLDVTMPTIDGYQVCNLIRKSSLLQHIPVIMVTANKGLVDRAKARLVGATDYLVKPFSQADLLNLSFRYLRGDP